MSIMRELNDARDKVNQYLEAIEKACEAAFGKNYVYFTVYGGEKLRIYVEDRALAMKTYGQLGDKGFKKDETEIIGLECI